MKLGDRMKGYEKVNKQQLMPRTPAIIRIDGKAFHTWTRGLDTPFDNNFTSWMGATMKYLVNNIQCAVFGYRQSDEISILLRDYDKFETQQWFNGGIQKIASVSASMATGKFNEIVSAANVEKPLAFFDSRVFSVPKEEVTNYFIWRQKDAIRNSVQALGHNLVGHKKCQGLNNDELISLMINEYDTNWHDLPYHFKNGITYARGEKSVNVVVPEFAGCREIVDIHVSPELFM